MPELKRTYISPAIESERLNLPEALGDNNQNSCDIKLANSSAWYYGNAYGYEWPTFEC